MNIKLINHLLIISLVCFTTIARSEYPGEQDATKGIKKSSISIKSTIKSKKDQSSAKKDFNRCCRGNQTSLLGPASNCGNKISNATPFKFNNLCMNLIDQAGNVEELSSDEYYQYLLLKNAESGDIFSKVSGSSQMCSASNGEEPAKFQNRYMDDSSSKYVSFCYSKDEYSNFRGKEIDEMSAQSYIDDVIKQAHPKDDPDMPWVGKSKKHQTERRTEYCRKKNMVYPQMDSELGKICITEEEADTLGSKIYSEQIHQEFEDMLNFCNGDCAVACEKKIQKVCSKMYPLIATSRYFHYSVCHDNNNRAKCKKSCIDKNTSFKLINCIR